MAKKNLPKHPQRKAITVGSLLVCIIALYYLIFVSQIGVLSRAIVAVIVLILASQAIIKANRMRSVLGAYLYGGQGGIKFVETLANINPRFWNAFADWGIVISFGLASYFLFKGQISKKMLGFGMACMFGMLYLVLPYSSVAFQFINIPQITSHINSAPSQGGVASALSSPVFYLINAVLLVGGFALFILYNLVSYSIGILYGILLVAPTVVAGAPNYGPISSQAPGVAPIIPGITIPLFAGLVVLAIILIVHEFSHGVLSRVAKIKLKEIGLLVMGVIPIGAYVEPDEKQMKKVSKEKQSRILVAGVASNMALCIVMFTFLVIITTYILPNFMTTKVMINAIAPNSPAFGVIPAGVQLLEWNGHLISNMSSLYNATSKTPFAATTIQTSSGNYSLVSNQTGKIGVSLLQVTAPVSGIGGSAVYFLYIVAALSFLLNFLVGVVNLLPVPSFDGWQIYSLLIKNKKHLTYLGWVAIGSILVNILPWIWAH